MKYAANKASDVQIAYIGGGSRGWAWTFMTDLALEPSMSGTIRLYDIDEGAAKANEVIGNRVSAREEAVGKWEYKTYKTIEEALTGADFVVTQLFFERGLALSPKVDKDVFAGIARVKSYLLQGKLKIFSTCTNLIREFKSYWWGSGDSPVKKDDHALDALRYYIMSRPAPPDRPLRVKTEIEKDKEMMMRKRRRY